MTKKKVLVFPCGSEIGLEIHKSLKDSTHFDIIGGSSVDDHGAYTFEQYIGDLPSVDAPEYLDKLNDVIESHGIAYVFPAHDSVVLRLAQAQSSGNLKCGVITSPLETCEIARSKRRTYESLQDVIPTPHVYDPTNIPDAAFPIFLKPDVGQGSKGTQRVNNQEELTFYLKKDRTLLALEYLPGREYTVDCFTNSDGELLFSEGRERQRIMNGISVRTAKAADPRFVEIAQTLNNNLTFRGVWFFQVKEDTKGDLKLMEIAPRVAGTMGFARCKGVNLPLMSLFQAEGIPVSVMQNDLEMTMDRALANAYKHNVKYEHVYIDFDDLLLSDQTINPTAIAYIFQCINKGVKVHLLTKHKDDLEQTLVRYRLSNIFDEVIWIRDGTEKYLYIKESDSIFIDDSFMERKKVHEAHGIPTYDNHMLEGLMEL